MSISTSRGNYEGHSFNVLFESGSFRGIVAIEKAHHVTAKDQVIHGFLRCSISERVYTG